MACLCEFLVLLLQNHEYELINAYSGFHCWHLVCPKNFSLESIDPKGFFLPWCTFFIRGDLGADDSSIFPQQYLTLLQDLRVFTAQHGGSQHLQHQFGLISTEPSMPCPTPSTPTATEWRSPAYQAATVVWVELLQRSCANIESLEATEMTEMVVGSSVWISFIHNPYVMHVMYSLQTPVFSQVSQGICCWFIIAKALASWVDVWWLTIHLELKWRTGCGDLGIFQQNRNAEKHNLWPGCLDYNLSIAYGYYKV